MKNKQILEKLEKIEKLLGEIRDKNNVIVVYPYKESYPVYPYNPLSPYDHPWSPCDPLRITYTSGGTWGSNNDTEVCTYNG